MTAILTRVIAWNVEYDFGSTPYGPVWLLVEKNYATGEGFRAATLINQTWVENHNLDRAGIFSIPDATIHEKTVFDGFATFEDAQKHIEGVIETLSEQEKVAFWTRQ